MGTLGAGNHYAEVQVVDKVFDRAAARKMGIDQEGQVLWFRTSSQSLELAKACPCWPCSWKLKLA